MIKNKKIKILTISILCILTITIGLSYGYYLLNKVQENNNIAGSKCFNLEFTNEKNAISLDKMYPISDEEGRKLTPYSFTITNTCDMLAGYTVNMEMLEGTTLNSKYLDVMVNNEQIKLLTNYESTNTVITGSTESRILAKGTLAYNDSVDYTVRFWMDKDVEDTESMNKLFKSKIVISATPSSWNPKDAGYDTLHDAILANEYQTTPADALKKIEAKGEPDLSQTAPVIKWVEKTGESTTLQFIKPAESAIKSDDQTSNLTENDTKLKLYTSYEFDETLAKYTLSGLIYADPTELDFSENKNYYIINEYINYDNITKKLYTWHSNSGTVIYKLKGASKSDSSVMWNEASYDGILYKLDTIELLESEIETDNSDKGIYKGIDDYGTTYYYRGNIQNNHVYFANNYWRIVRINGDGTIRVIYNGKSKTDKDEISIGNTSFNIKYDSPAYVGYMYGNPDGKTFDEVHSNTNDSTVKLLVDDWYKVNVYDNNYNDFVSISGGFCGDRETTGNGVSKTVTTYFEGYNRHSINKAIFKCSNLNRDLYTTNDSERGNKSLTYPVGLITYDELVYAGLDGKHLNKLSWIYSGSSGSYWTMTPAMFYNVSAHSQVMIFANYINAWNWINSYRAVRPVINLKSDVKITGGIGTSNDPYVIDTSK